VITPKGSTRRFYEICALSELKNALPLRRHLGKGLRGQFRDFTTTCCRQEVPPAQHAPALPLAINPNSNQYLKAACSCWTSSWGPPSPACQGQRAARMPSSPSQAERSPTGFRGAQYRAGLIDRPAQFCARIKRTRTVDGRGRLDGASAATSPHLKVTVPSQRRGHCCCQRLPGRCDQPRLTQDGRVRGPALTLRQAVLAAATGKHPRRNLLGGPSRAGQTTKLPSYLAAHWGDGTNLFSDGQRSGRAVGAKAPGHVKPEVRQRAGGAVLHP